MAVVITELQRHIGGFRNATMEYKTATQGAASLLVAALDPALQSKNSYSRLISPEKECLLTRSKS